jgi:hypothetical protein
MLCETLAVPARSAVGSVRLKRDGNWPSRFSFLFEHDLFGKPVSTFPDHALACECLMMKLESLKVSDRPALLPGSSPGPRDIRKGGARA